MASFLDQGDELIYEEEEYSPVEKQQPGQNEEEMEEGEISGPEEQPRVRVVEQKVENSRRRGLIITIDQKPEHNIVKQLPVSLSGLNN